MTIGSARVLRKRPTIAERKLWRQLRDFRHRGYHFRRQAPLEGFIVDFACLSQRLVIEVDGYQHTLPREMNRDSERDAQLRWKGYTVLRFDNHAVLQEEEGVIMEILAALGALEKPIC